jgi:hypothetical protein
MRFAGATKTFLVSVLLGAAVLCSGVIATTSSSASASFRFSCSDLSAFPTSSTFPVQGGIGSVNVNNPTGCNWAVRNNTSFVTITSVNTNNGSGPGFFNFSVPSNPDGPREGFLRIVDSGNPDGPGIDIKVSQAGATVPLYRYWNPTIYNHFYTTDFGELGNGAQGYNFEWIQCRVFANQVSGTVPLKRYYCAENGDHFYTTNPSEPGPGLPCYHFERIECYVYNNQVSGTLPLYRYYEPNAFDHFYTTNFNELGNGSGGWYLEGTQCYVFPQ